MNFFNPRFQLYMFHINIKLTDNNQFNLLRIIFKYHGHNQHWEVSLRQRTWWSRIQRMCLYFEKKFASKRFGNIYDCLENLRALCVLALHCSMFVEWSIFSTTGVAQCPDFLKGSALNEAVKEVLNVESKVY